ncbi:MAG: hypothetical protein E5299_01946 [Burkholderia gladioli]|nr:MAG: hypothetical protein E5299_01946 [Burkholderia gladioli]
MRISYLSAVCKRFDAISNAVSQEMRWLDSEGRQTHLFTYSCNQPNLRYTRVRTLSDVALHPYFQHSDLIVCHFGVYFDMFDAILAAPRSARILIVFHNITPKYFVAPEQHDLIDRSFAQMANIQHADRVICVSETNLAVMREAGISTPATVQPQAVPGGWSAPASKPSQHDGVIRLLFIGRFVRSKGLPDLLQAVESLMQFDELPRLELALVGNLALSGRDVVAEVQRIATALQSRYPDRLAIHMHFSIDDTVKRKLLSDADVFVLPTYHEGFCVPIVEAISSGCRVVTYNNSNTPSISRGLAELVETGNIAALATRLRQVITAARPSRQASRRYDAYREQVREFALPFSEHRVKEAFLSEVGALLRPD